MNRDYISKQAQIYATTNSRAVELDALWRIASHLDLISSDCQQLSDGQAARIVLWLHQHGYLLAI